MKELLSKIMKRAWEIKRMDKDNVFSICLQMAWSENKTKLVEKKAYKVADSVSTWTKNGTKRLYVDYKGKSFFIDLTNCSNLTARYNSNTKGNICIVRDFLIAAGIKFIPLKSTYDEFIKIA